MIGLHSLSLAFMALYLFALYVSHRLLDTEVGPIAPGSEDAQFSHQSQQSFLLRKSSGTELNPQYVERSVLCPTCRTARIHDKEKTCWQTVAHATKTADATEPAALRKIMRKHSICQQSCEGNCSDADHITRILWRMDDIAPHPRSGRTYYLSSIPSEHRVPKQALSDLDAFFSAKENVYPQRIYFFEYNPSLVRIPDGYEIPKSISEPPTYLTTFRLATTQQCVTGKTERSMFGGTHPYPADNNALAVALLREDLTVIADVAVDMKAIDNYVQDFRVFAFDNQIYLSSHYFMRPLWLVKPTGPAEADIVQLKPEFSYEESHSQFDVFVREYPSCPRYKAGKKNGKNLNLFRDTVNQKIMLELHPRGAKIRVDLNEVCEHDAEEQDPLIEPSLDSAQDPTFLTIEEKYYGNAILFMRDRGSACCVSFADPRHPTGPPLLLGISHTKTLRGPVNGFKNQYVSRFYAMESTSPYKVVAYSGHLCFGFSSESESDNPYARLNLNRLMIGEGMACPRIHFVSGMIEKATDPARLLIGYGINDCVPRIVEVEKEHVVHLLFPPEDVRLK